MKSPDATSVFCQKRISGEEHGILDEPNIQIFNFHTRGDVWFSGWGKAIEYQAYDPGEAAEHVVAKHQSYDTGGAAEYAVDHVVAKHQSYGVAEYVVACAVVEHQVFDPRGAVEYMVAKYQVHDPGGAAEYIVAEYQAYNPEEAVEQDAHSFLNIPFVEFLIDVCRIVRCQAFPKLVKCGRKL